MTTLRTAAQQALEAMTSRDGDSWTRRFARDRAIEALEAALAEPEGGGNLPPPLQKPGDFDHNIGADRFKVVRGAFWWHVLIGDSPTEHGKFHSRVSAEKMAADLLREFRNGAFVQHEAALAEPVQEPVAGRAFFERILAAMEGVIDVADRKTDEFDALRSCVIDLTLMLHTAPPQLPAEPVQEPVAWMMVNETYATACERRLRWTPAKDWHPTWEAVPLFTAPPQRLPLTDETLWEMWVESPSDVLRFARAIERAHGITS